MVGNQEIISKTENQNVSLISMLFENVKVNNQERAKRLEGDCFEKWKSVVGRSEKCFCTYIILMQIKFKLKEMQNVYHQHLFFFFPSSKCNHFKLKGQTFWTQATTCRLHKEELNCGTMAWLWCVWHYSRPSVHLQKNCKHYYHRKHLKAISSNKPHAPCLIYMFISFCLS